MNLSYDSLAVGFIVLGAAGWAARSVWRAFRQKRICETCGSNGECPLVKDKSRPAALVPGLEPLARPDAGGSPRPENHLPG